MEFLDIKNIAERYMEIVNPTTEEKILKLGEKLELASGMRIIDFGCGYAEALVLWAEAYGISGIGIDIREPVCNRANEKLRDRGLADRIEVVCGKGAEYKFEPGSFDIAACIGATFVFGGYRETIQAMKKAIKPTGKLAVGEIYWRTEGVPPEYVEELGAKAFTEYELLQITREEGFDFEYIIRSSLEDWDRYEGDNWKGLLRWLEENPDHPEKQDVLDHFHKSQDEHVRYVREFLGWAIYVLNPVRYL